MPKEYIVTVIIELFTTYQFQANNCATVTPIVSTTAHYMPKEYTVTVTTIALYNLPILSERQKAQHNGTLYAKRIHSDSDNSGRGCLNSVLMGL